MYLTMTMTDHYDLVQSFGDELVECVRETRRISKGLLSQGLLSEDKYRTIIAAGSTQHRMKLLLQDLASKGQRGRDALYRLLQEHEPDLTLQMEKERVLQMNGLDFSPTEKELRERSEELLKREMELEKEREDLRREREKLQKSRTEVEKDKKQLAEMKSGLERGIWKRRDATEEPNSRTRRGKEEERMTGEL